MKSFLQVADFVGAVILVRDEKQDIICDSPAATNANKLWNAYENATFNRVRAGNALDMAKALYSSPNKHRLERELEEASQAVEKCYESFRQHEAIAHQGQSRRAGAGA